MTGINTMTSGQPININYTFPLRSQVSGYPTYRPDYVGGDIYPSNEDSDAFGSTGQRSRARPTNSRSATLGRNIARTESIYNFDLGLHKEFPLV